METTQNTHEKDAQTTVAERDEIIDMRLNFSSADAAGYFYTRLQTRQAQMAHLNTQSDKTHSDLPQAPTTETDAPDQLRADAAHAAIEHRVQARLREA